VFQQAKQFVQNARGYQQEKPNKQPKESSDPLEFPQKNDGIDKSIPKSRGKLWL
jgi:hypothetical protein